MFTGLFARQGISQKNYSETTVPHGTVESGTEDFSASNGGGHTINPTGDQTWTYSGLPTGRLSHMAFEVTVENGDAPSITTSGAYPVRSGSFDTLADGVTLVEVFSFNGTSGYQLVTNP